MFSKTLTGLTLVGCALFVAVPAQAAPTSTCYINDGYAVSSVVNVDESNEVFAVKAKASADEAITCPLPETEADLVIGKDAFGQSYEDLLANHLVMSVSTGPVGDLVVIDLRDGKEILNVSGDYDYTSDEGIVYWERGADGTAETCDSYAELTAMGLGTRILNGMLLNLETKTSTPTGDTTCEGVS